MLFFRPNLETKGRLIRGLAAAFFLLAAALLWPHSAPAAGALIVAGGFIAFEATRGWCALRACGVKTKF